MAKRLTLKMLRAIEEALTARLAGEIDIEADRDDYEAALDWIGEQIAKREAQ